MSRDEATPQDEQFAALLAAFDDALAAGAPPTDHDAPDAIQARLNEDLECLHLLHQLRPPSAGRESNQRNLSPLEEDRGVGGETPAAESGVRYSLIRPHAVGGIGRVWLAYDADLGR